MRKFYHQYSSINVSLTKLSHKALARSFNLFTASNSWHSSVRHRKKVPNVEPPCGIIEAAVGYKPWKWIPKKAITLHSAPSWIFIVNFPDLASTQFRIRSVFKNFHSGERIQKVGDSAGYTWYVWTEAEVADSRIFGYESERAEMNVSLSHLRTEEIWKLL